GLAIKRLKLERHKGQVPWVRWAIASIVLGLGVAGCSRFFHTGAAKQETKAESKEKAKPPYDVRVELFRNQMGNVMLSTDKWIYETGKLSPDGFVVEIAQGQVK